MSIYGAQTHEFPTWDDEARFYDALLVLSFGGPEAREEVIPFLQRVAQGRAIPRERLEEVAAQYDRLGGVSPLNAQNRALISALGARLQADGPHLPIYFGNRNWHPFVADTLRQLRDDGRQRVLVFVTSAFSSYSGCRQYREDVMRANADLGEALAFDKLRVFYNHPGFIQAVVEHTVQALTRFPEDVRGTVHFVFTAHSIPLEMAQHCDYVAQLQEAASLVAAQIGTSSYQLVFQSRSGSPQIPWLEPDIGNYLEGCHAHGIANVLVIPLGFISDHMEVLYDLDTKAKQRADELQIRLVRAETVGTHPAFIDMIRELIFERMTDHPERRFLGKRGPSHDICPLNCCLPGKK
jgi:ferrochelatase